MKHIVLRALLFTLTVAIWYLSLTGNPPLPETGIRWFDKVEHTGAYGVLAFVAVLTFEQVMGGWRPLLLLISLVSGQGVLLEFLQGSMNRGRSFEVADMGAKTVGALFGALLAYLLIRHRKGEN